MIKYKKVKKQAIFEVTDPQARVIFCDNLWNLPIADLMKRVITVKVIESKDRGRHPRSNKALRYWSRLLIKTEI